MLISFTFQFSVHWITFDNLLSIIQLTTMKSSLFIACFVLYSISLFGQAKSSIADPVVDERVELLSIAFRLAECHEYMSMDNEQYVHDIHQHFDKYKDHALIKYITKMRAENGVGYDAVMFMAVHLNPAPALTPIVPFTATIPETRWGKAGAIKFAKLLQQFYKDADCKAFFQSESAYYRSVEKEFSTLFHQLDVSWYYKYYGKAPKEHFNVIIGIGIGGNNFGPNVVMPDKAKNVYAIIGSCTFDSSGKPIYETSDYLPTLIHEFNHSFINYLSDISERSLKKAGEIINNKEQEKMKSQGYGPWKTMINESLVRASVIRYLMSHDPDTAVAEKELKTQLARGFVWMSELVALLGDYETRRSTYPTFESYMPVIVHFYDTVAPRINDYDKNYANHCAHIVSVTPVTQNATNVDPTITELVFNFDKPLDGKRYFFGPGKKGAEHYPESVKFSFSNGNKTITMKMKLKPGTDYQVNMIGRMMRTSEGYSVQDHLLEFTTGQK